MRKKHLIVRSRNHTCSPLKEIVVSRTTILRLGSTTPTERITKDPNPIELNSAEACAISGDKRLMKESFVKAEIPTAEYITLKSNTKEEGLQVLKSLLSVWGVLICKKYNSSKGTGIFLLSSVKEIEEWLDKYFIYKSDYIFERYYTYSREYRIHVTKDGYFYTCRKMLKRDAEVRWHRHNENCVWIVEENPLFNKPNNWEDIVRDCVKALDAIGLDIAAFDVKVQNSKHLDPDYIILESNSAPSLGEIGLQKYKEILPKIIYEKELLNA